MYERRWPLVTAVVVGVLVVGATGWALGRSTAPEGVAEAKDSGDRAAIRVVEGVPVGVQRSRAGALAAADNYVAIASETAVQDPARYERLVRQTYDAGYQGTGLREGAEARESSPQSVELYRAGGRSLAVVAARRLDSYSGARAKITTWTAGVTWGPTRSPGHTWSLTETNLVWMDDRWRVEGLDVATRPAPAPRRLGYRLNDQLRTATFERELRAMTAPVYGAS